MKLRLRLWHLVLAWIIVVATLVAAEGTRAKKLWVSREYDEHGDRVLFVQDLETGTRCYAITNSSVNMSGYAISCVGLAATR